VDDALIEYTERVGQLVASAGRPLVSGGARGIDQAAMRGALEAGGRVTGVLADSLERKVMQREHRNMVLDGRLILISPYDPNAGFNVGHAMQRNKLIYALADAALVVSAEVDKGGTWAGATEQLDKLHLVPVYVRSTGTASAGLDALRKKGAQSWPTPHTAEDLDKALAADPPDPKTTSRQRLLFSDAREDHSQPQEVAEAAEISDPLEVKSPIDIDRKAADILSRTVRSLLLHLLHEPKKPSEIAVELNVTKRQAERWLQQATEEGDLEKKTKPVRYRTHPDRLPAEPAGASK